MIEHFKRMLRNWLFPVSYNYSESLVSTELMLKKKSILAFAHNTYEHPDWDIIVRHLQSNLIKSVLVDNSADVRDEYFRGILRGIEMFDQVMLDVSNLYKNSIKPK